MAEHNIKYKRGCGFNNFTFKSLVFQHYSTAVKARELLEELEDKPVLINCLTNSIRSTK